MSSSAVTVTERVQVRPSTRTRKSRRNKMERVRPGETSSAQFVVQPKFPNAGAFDGQVYNVVLSANKSYITSSTVASVGTSFTFQFSDINDYGSWGSVFDTYRIAMVELTFIPTADFNPAPGSTGVGSMGNFVTVVDYDDSAALTSLGQATDYANAMVGTGFQQQRRTLKPHAASALYGGSAFTSYGNVEAPWIDAASSGVPHYGVKSVWTQTGTACRIDVFARYWMQFRNAR